MGQKGQRSDTHTLTHEAQTLTRDVVTAPFRLRTYRLIRKILIGFILVSIANVLFSYFFYTPKMYRIIRRESITRRSISALLIFWIFRPKAMLLYTVMWGHRA